MLIYGIFSAWMTITRLNGLPASQINIGTLLGGIFLSPVYLLMRFMVSADFFQAVKEIWSVAAANIDKGIFMLVISVLDIIVNHFIGNKNDEERIKSKDNTYELRKILSYYSTDTQLEEKTLDKAVDLFLLFLRTYSIEATMGLNGLLDTIWKSGKVGNEWNCVKRITGILAAVYLLYFVHEAKIYDKNETEKNMREIFRKNISFYTMEDKRFLTQIFMLENQNDCLTYLLHSNLKCCDKSEKYTVDSERIMAKEFFRILKKFKKN